MPKAIQCKLVKLFEKIDLPECFANINSNQRYNRRTITELTKHDTELADALIKTIKIKISKENFLNYLSPIEFETLCFMIFNSGKSFCSSFRGGTLAGVDLRVITNNEFHGFPRKMSIQVKKKETIKNRQNGIYYFTCGGTNLNKNEIGREWIIQEIKKRDNVKRWLTKMFSIYKNVFEFKW